MWGRSLLAASILAVLAGVILYTVDLKALAAWSVRYPVILPGAALLSLAALALVLPRRRQIRLALQQDSKERGAEPPEMPDSASVAAKDRMETAIARAQDLRFHLKQRRWFRWSYAQQWLLVAGDNTAIIRLVPELHARGWLVTEDVVLLLGGTTPDCRLDEPWLRQVRRLRWCRPLDAIVLLVDDTTSLTGSGRSRSPWDFHLARITNLLRWSAPIYVLDVAGTDPVHRENTAVTGCEFPRSTDASAIEAALLDLRDRLADRSVHQLINNRDDRYVSELSARLDTRGQQLASWIASLSSWQRRPLPVAGAFFAPWPVVGTSKADSDTVHLPLWRYLADAVKRTPGRRTFSHPVTVISLIALTFIGIWSAGMIVSGITNAHELTLTNDALHTLDRAGDTPTRLRALLALQQRIGLHEARVDVHTPLLARFGLNHDRAVLNALWTPYARAARPLLVAPVQRDIEGQLADLSQISIASLDTQVNRIAQNGHQALKTYLMLADPRRADADFMTPQLEHHWNLDTGLRAGEKANLSTQLLSFWAQHFPSHPDWRIQPREDLVGNARQTLLAIIGVKNSEDTIYQNIIDSVGHKYPDQTLASLTMGTDPRGLFSTATTVPGAFSREAWEGSIEAAIDEAANHNGVTRDWVLDSPAGAQPDKPAAGPAPDALRATLRAHYFSDYAEHWQAFMNSVRCEATPTLPAAVSRLKLIADARQSPLIALMKSLAWQGSAGVQRASLSDALVTRAQNLFAKKDDVPQAAQVDPAGPLGASFGPVLRLVAQGSGKAAPAGGDLSLDRFTERVMALRLKLQQISDSADPNAEARQVAQSLFRGKGSELSDTLAYAHLVAASLGEQWAPMGDALFVQSIEQATQTVLMPAEASLNDAWRTSIFAAWNRSFAGRYPFASTANDASLPELARFVRVQGGLIDVFLSTELAGVLERQGDQWVPASGAGTRAGGSARAFDPAFLKAINTLQQISAHLLPQGEPQYTFALKPVPSADVTDTLLTLDGQTLHYYNQQETWHTMTWPSSTPQVSGTRLDWQTDTAGTNQNFEFTGRWALVRMLEHAKVEPVDSATYQLTWQASAAGPDPATVAPKADRVEDTAALTVQGPLVPAPSTITHPLRYLIRTDVGKGPLELLALRGFALPSRIFVDRTRPVAKQPSSNGPPPLPKTAREAARRAAVPIPPGRVPS
nr:ImcF-related family protein [Paraburkholderia rhizosphaerae]